MLSIGIDLVETRRIKRYMHRYGKSFLKNIFCPAEIEGYSKESDLLALAFSAKEATAKALGTGFAHISRFGILPIEIEILFANGRIPESCHIQLAGAARRRAIHLKLNQWWGRLVQNGDCSIAFVIAASKNVAESLIVETLDHACYNITCNFQLTHQISRRIRT